MINKKNKKGVSDVITTVLIILLVLAAVAIIGGILLRNIGEAGSKIGTQTACIDLDVKPVTCTKTVSPSAGTTYNVQVSRGGRGSEVGDLASVTLLFNKGGVVTTLKTGDTDVTGSAPQPLQTVTVTYTATQYAPGDTYDSVKVAASVKGADGKATLCDPALDVVDCKVPA